MMNTIDSVEQEYELHNAPLFDFQYDVFMDESRYKVVAAGRRTGKSHLACVMAINHCTLEGNRRVLMVGPTYGQAREAFWTTLKSIVHRDWLDGLPREADLELRFINGSKISLKGSDRPDTLRGISPSPTMIICDEFAFFKQNVWEEVIMPQGADPVRKASFFIISTPKGVGNTFHELWERGQDQEFPDWKSWQFAAAQVRPDMKEEIVLARNTLDPRTFSQEYEASFLNTGNAVFTFDRTVHVRKDLEPFLPGEAIHIALDFNVAIMAASAFAMRGDQLHCLSEFMGDANTEEFCKSVKERYPNRKIVIYPDPSGSARKSSAATGITDFSILRSAGFTVRSRNSHPSIKDSVNAVNRLLLDANDNTRIFFDHLCTNTIRSMEGTQWKEVNNSSDLDSATIDKGAGVEHHSDGVRYICEYLFPVTHRGAVVRKSKLF